MVAHQAVTDGAPIFRFSYGDRPEPTGAGRTELHYVRASGIAQARLQLAVLTGNRRRALEQIDRLVEIDSLLERFARGERDVLPDAELEQELAEQRLAIASEKLALLSGVELPRLEPAFGAGMGQVLGAGEEIEIVEDHALRRRLVRLLLLGAGLLIACSLTTIAILTQI